MACECANKELREVVYKNGTKHAREVCVSCGKGKLVSRKTEAQKIAAKSRALKRKYGDSFYTGTLWLKLRYEVLATNERICALCGSREKPLHVDHIKPRSRYPEMQYEKDNLQILCAACNLGKLADHEHDFREVK